MRNIQKYLTKNEQQIIDMLKQMVEYESPSRNRELTNIFCSYLEDLFGKIAKAEKISHENRQQKVGDDLKIEFGEGEDQILILCHMDTVWSEGEISKRPFMIEENKIFGPGIFDMKFGILQIYWVLKTLEHFKLKLNFKIVIYIDSHEEIGARQSLKFLESEALNSKCILVLEPSMFGGFKIQRKGLSVYNIKVTGRSSHAGGRHSYGISAIKELAHQIINIEGLTDYDKGITVNFGYIKGGKEVNIIPEHAEAKFELRYWTNEQKKEIENILFNIKPKIEGAQVEVSLYREVEPLEKNEMNLKLFEFAKEIGAKMDLDIWEKPAGGISNANRLAHLNIPTLDGLGAVGLGAHAKDEHILKDKIIERIELLANIIIELSKTNYK